MTDRELFAEALDIADLATRGMFLGEHAADAAQLARVQRLLQSHAASGRFLEQNIEDYAPTLFEPSTTPAQAMAGLEPGALFAGRYRFEKLLGQGGMGVVWAADQLEPVTRRVAIKFMRPGIDSAAVVARFEAERQALAMMDHTNIAKVYDGGTTPEGRPYVVMELVEGVPLTEFCDQNQLTIRKRLELFINVCQAVHHAHQKGILHRDLKPSNVLVSFRDGKATAKVIDFGIAKAIVGRLTDNSMNTGFGTVLGTPQYMSPEQAGMGPNDVDIRADIYSLGAMFYELLAGRPPFDVPTGSGTAGVFNLLKSIRDEEPHKPSALARSAETLFQVASARGTPIGKLPQLLKGELDWIAMKCLEKDRERRYESAHSLALDVQRYLDDEPISAVGPSTLYRTRKFFRRHRHSVALASLLFVLLSAGLVVTLLANIRATRAEADALATAAVAEHNYQLAQRAVDQFLMAIADDEQLKRNDHHELRRRLLNHAVPFYEQLASARPNDREQQIAQATALGRYGDVCRELGDANAALTAFAKAEKVIRQLDLTQPENALRLGMVLRRLGDMQTQLGEYRKAHHYYDGCMNLLSPLAFRSTEMGLAIRAEMGRCLNNCGLMVEMINEPNSAEKYYRNAMRLFDELVQAQPDVRPHREMLAVCRNNLGNLMLARRSWGEAKEHLREAVRITEELTKSDATDPSAIQKLAGGRANLARAMAANGEHLSARTFAEPAAKALRELADRFPRVPEYRAQWAGAESNAAMLQAEAGDMTGAVQRFTHVITVLEQLHETVPQAKEFLSHTYAGRAQAWDLLSRTAEAMGDWEQACSFAPEHIRTLQVSSRAAYLARLGEVDAAIRLVEPLLMSASAEVSYNVACVYALAFHATQSEMYATRALVALQEALTQGYADATNLKQDPDLASVRPRPEFAALVRHVMPLMLRPPHDVLNNLPEHVHAAL